MKARKFVWGNLKKSNDRAKITTLQKIIEKKANEQESKVPKETTHLISVTALLQEIE